MTFSNWETFFKHTVVLDHTIHRLGLSVTSASVCYSELFTLPSCCHCLPSSASRLFTLASRCRRCLFSCFLVPPASHSLIHFSFSSLSSVSHSFTSVSRSQTSCRPKMSRWRAVMGQRGELINFLLLQTTKNSTKNYVTKKPVETIATKKVR